MIFRPFFLFIFLCFSTIGYAGITIDSTHTTSSTCADNGTITIYAHTTGGALLYAIISGPHISPNQSSDQFINLPSGVYQLLVTDAAHDTVRIADTVRGSYTSPNFTPTHKNPLCPGTATGIIVGNPQNAGTPPFTWALTNLTTNITTTQASDSFYNLPVGNYSLREYDSCQNFATYPITLTVPNDSFSFIGVTNRIYNCDSVSLEIALLIYGTTFAAPYTIKVQTHNGAYQHIVTDIFYTAPTAQIFENVGGVSYGDSISFTITDACGRSVYRANTVSAFNINATYSSITDSCRVLYTGEFYVAAGLGQSNVNPTYMPEPITVVVRNVSTGALLDSTITNDTVNHFSEFGFSAALPAGQSYKVKITDGCGHSDTATYQWPSAPQGTTTNNIIHLSCMDSTASIEVLWQNTFFSLPTFHLLSGPTHIGSTKPHYVYSDTIIYPQTHLGVGNGSNGYYVQLTNLAVGTYHYSVSDSCGNTLIDSFTIIPANLNSDTFHASYINGCPGENTIIVSKDNFCYAFLIYGSNNVSLNSLFDTVGSLSAGTYVLSLAYSQTTYDIPVNLNPYCQLIRDTIVIPPYQTPQVASSTQISCHGLEYVVLLPDSATGVAPYKYQLISGPQTTGVQSSNIFGLTQAGAYTARITDTCGFAGTYTFTLDTVTFGPIITAGTTCVGNSVTISCLSSPYATYLWHLPSGGTYTGSSLYINPISFSNYGTYNISKIVNIDGCRDTFYATYKLSGTGSSGISASVCSGQSYLFAGISHSQSGTYYDTIPASPCDSIVILTLTIRAPGYDSVSQIICTGQSVTVGTHTYTTTGIYRDTFVTAGCDSFHILNLQVSGFRHGAISQTICTGQSYSFDGTSLSQSGIYYDTLTTSGCDSIVTLTLTVSSPAYDSVSQSICTGQSVTVGTHIYTTTGIYRDTFTTVNCDSIHVLSLLVSGYKYGFASATICQGQNLPFGNQTLTQSGIYFDTIPTSGCDSIVTLTLAVTVPAYDSVSQTICAGQSVTVGTNTYTTTGIYRDTFMTAGCDSIHVLNLTVGNYNLGFSSQTICQGQSLSFGTLTLTQAGTYYDTIPTTGCDSIAALTLSVTAPAYDSVSQSICTGQSVTVGTNTYTTTGMYRDTFTTANCDSIHVLNLTVGYLRGSISQTICIGHSIQFGGQILTQPGVYYDTITSVSCDSIVTLTLTTTTPAYDSVTASICDGQSIHVGIHTYTTAGIYRDTFTTINCDSIHVLNLTVGAPKNGSMSETICQGESLTIGTHTYTQAGTYLDSLLTAGGCDSVLTLQLTVNPVVSPTVSITVSHGPVISGIQIDTFTASYANCPDPYFSWFKDIVPLGIHTPVAIVSYPAGEADSILCRINCPDGCPANSITFSNSLFTGISQLSFIEGVNIYPNPTLGSFNMDINAPSIIMKDAQISVMDMFGQSIVMKQVTLRAGYNKEMISMAEAASGVYIVQLTLDGQSLYYRLVLDKQ
jgi:hypothetical protein